MSASPPFQAFPGSPGGPSAAQSDPGLAVNETSAETQAFLGYAVEASFVDYLDSRVLLVLRDGEMYLGILRSFDQFHNIVLEQCYHRRVVESTFADVECGLVVVRGDNICFVAQIDAAKHDSIRDGTAPVRQVPAEEVYAALEELDAAVPPGKARPHSVYACLDDDT